MSRRGAVCASVTIGAVLVTALATQEQPFAGLLITAGIVVAYSATVPSPGWRLAGRLARKALRAATESRPAASAFGWNVLRACARPDATQEPAAAGQHEAWVTHLRYIAQMQRDARPSHPDDCFCSCGIDPAALAWFRDDLEVIAQEMQRRGREDEARRRGQ